MASTATTAARATPSRDPYVDFIRAFSLLVVVAWHWVFTIIIWEDDGPHATNPIGFTTGLWVATWLLQVMPVFFYVGGYSHLQAWRKAAAAGQTIGGFTWRRLKGLAVPALALLTVWVALGAVLKAIYDWAWIGRTVTLVVSPLWFIAVYLMLVSLLPLMIRLHERFDTVVLVVLGGAAGAVDILRFRYDLPDQIALLNMIFVWGLCHQLGFFYRNVVDGRRTVDWSLMLAGLFGLAGLVGSDLYPGSMVGVPGETSNMAPPTLCIVALVLFQAGVIEVIRPAVERRLARPTWLRVSATINRFSLPLFLFHSTGMALHRAVSYGLFGENEARRPDLGWWLYRPFAFIGPLLFTLPVIYVFGRQWAGRSRQQSPAAARG